MKTNILACLPKKAQIAIANEISRLRAAGVQENAKTFECNLCGETHNMKNCYTGFRGNVPVVVCSECTDDTEFTFAR